MKASDLFILLPFLVLSASAVLILVGIGWGRYVSGRGLRPRTKTTDAASDAEAGMSFIDNGLDIYRSHLVIMPAALAALCAGLAALFIAAPAHPQTVTPLFLIDGHTIFYCAIILIAGIALTLLSYSYLKELTERPEEYYVLLLFAVFGACVLVAANHFAALFLGLEILNISLYALIAYKRTQPKSLEAGFKYLILAAMSDAFLLFGIALLYSQTGSLSFSGLIVRTPETPAIVLAGLGMIFVGFGFKLALAPFHIWAADVYEGAPAPVTALIATISKAAVFAAILRVVGAANLTAEPAFQTLLTLLAVLSMFVGNFLALLQTNLKRLLAYSSIAHIGYVVIGLLAYDLKAVDFYFAAYFVTTLGAFGVVTLLSKGEYDADTIEQYRGLAAVRPWPAVILSACMLSLAGIPVTAGFLGKFYLLQAGVGASKWLLVMSLVLNSVVGLYYYLRVIVVMFLPVSSGIRPVLPNPSFTGGIALAALLVLLVILGVYPGPFIDALDNALRLM